MDVSMWQKRLEDNFTQDGIIGGKDLLTIVEMEKKYGMFFEKTYFGQSVAIHSFQGFFLETIHTAEQWIKSNGLPSGLNNYPVLLLYYVTLFKSYRACEHLLRGGYPFDGYALLRDIKDRSIFTCAIAKNITTLPKIMGYEEFKEASREEWKRIKANVKKEEFRVLNIMIRAESGLPEDSLKELTIWEQLFHEEVHGSRFSFTECAEWLKGKEPLSIGPIPKEQSMSMYMNRSVEMAWLLVKLLPFLQPVEKAFGTAWLEKQKILDDSFRVMITELGNLGKEIADAFICFVDNKFQFPETFHYFEADGSS